MSTSRIKGIILFLAFSLFWIGPVGAQDVQTAYRSAAAAYYAGDLGKAASILQIILRQRPQHTPSRMLLGRVYYRSGRVRDAARQFLKGSRDGRGVNEPGLAFEYGVSAFQVGRCEAALRAFLTEMRGPMAGYAHFYSGICHARARRWYLAEDFLTRASGLPQNFEAMRRRVLSQVMRHRASSARQREEPMQAQTWNLPPLPPDPDRKDSDKSGIQKPEKAKSFTVGITPALEYYMASTTLDRSGTGSTTTNMQGPKLSGKLVPRYAFEPEADDHSIAIFVELYGDIYSYDSSSTDIKYMTEQEGTGDIYTDESSSRVNDKQASYYVKPQLYLPLGSTVQLTGGGKFLEKFPQMKVDSKEIHYGPNGNLVINIADASLSGSGEYLNKEKLVVSEESEEIVTTSESILSGSLTLPLGNGFSILAGSKYTSTTNPKYADPDTLGGFQSKFAANAGATKTIQIFSFGVDGNYLTKKASPDSPISGVYDEMGGVFSLGLNFSFGLSLSVKMEYALINSYQCTGLTPSSTTGLGTTTAEDETTATATATGTRQGAKLGVKYNPVEWAFAKLNYSYTQVEYSVKQPELQASFIQKVPDQISGYELTLGLSYTF